MNPYFDVYPKIVPADKPLRITIKPLFDHCRFNSDGEYQVSVFPAEGFAIPKDGARSEIIRLSPHDGALHVPIRCDGEQEYILWVERITGEKRTAIGEFRVYSLADDLFGRYPYKGDVHLHSHYSDGRESPGYVAGACRRVGLDFMALTDHRRYAPSLEAAQVYDGVDIDLRIYPGEEVHPPKTSVHIVNFGARYSVNDMFASDAFNNGVAKLMESLTHIPEAYRYQYAASVWAFDQIRAGGGLAIFPHPYWFIGHRYDVPEALTSLLFEHQPYDALQVIGSFYHHEMESNILQVARYHEERAKGRKIPIVGASDTHHCERGELLGEYYTIAFSPSSDLEDLITAVKDLYSVAVEALPGETPRAHGPFRLVKYAQFLLREVLPGHDELCAHEGRLMLAYLAGDQDAATQLSQAKGRVAKYYKHLWADVG